MEFSPSEKGTPIRNPSTANLAINSRDRAKIIPQVTATITNAAATTTTITITANNNFSVGNPVYFSGLTGAGAALNGLNGLTVATVTGSYPYTGFTVTGTGFPTVTSGNYGGIATSIVTLYNPQPYQQSSSDFTISNKNNILTGFFTRMAVNEVVLQWNKPNIVSAVNNEFIVRIGTTNTSVLLNTGYFTVKDALDAIVVALNASLGAATFSITTTTELGVATLTKATGSFTILLNNLSAQLGFPVSSQGVWNFGTSFTAYSPFLMNETYIDIVSTQLTYCQDLKDSSTATSTRDIVYRWNFGWEGEPTYDGYGYPVLQGYKAFNARRSIPFPKQIKWDNIQPIGQLQLQLYTDDGTILPQPVPSINNPTILYLGQVEYSLNLLVSEV